MCAVDPTHWVGLLNHMLRRRTLGLKGHNLCAARRMFKARRSRMWTGGCLTPGTSAYRVLKQLGVFPTTKWPQRTRPKTQENSWTSDTLRLAAVIARTLVRAAARLVLAMPRAANTFDLRHGWSSSPCSVRHLLLASRQLSLQPPPRDARRFAARQAGGSGRWRRRHLNISQ